MGPRPSTPLSRASVGVVVTFAPARGVRAPAGVRGRLSSADVSSPPRAGPPPNTPRPATPGVDHAFDRDVFLLASGSSRSRRSTRCGRRTARRFFTVERPTYPVRTLRPICSRSSRPLTVMGGRPGRSPRDGSGLIVFLSGAFAAFHLPRDLDVGAPTAHVTILSRRVARETFCGVIQDQRVAFPDPDVHVVTGPARPSRSLRKTYLHNIVRKRWYRRGGRGRAGWRWRSRTRSCCHCSAGPRTFFGFLRTNFVVRPRRECGDLREFNRKFTLLTLRARSLGRYRRTF